MLLAGTAVSAAVSLLAIPAHWLPVNSGTSEIVLVIGMAVGVDYSLFYLRREREERAAGHSHRAALRIAASTSGRAIVISGVTVMISLAGLFLSGVDIFTGISAGTIMVVGVTVLGSLTFLPALLSWLGPWADRGRLPWLGRAHKDGTSSRMWTGLARRVVDQAVRVGRRRRGRAAGASALPPWACGSARRRWTCPTTCRSCTRSTRSPATSPVPRPRPRSC